MSNNRDLTGGSITRTLLRLALPIMGTQLMQMTYNLTDMFWLGRVGTNAVAASGTAGLFMWLSVGFMLIGRVGAEIGVSQSRGKGDVETAAAYARAALHISAVLGLLYGVFLLVLRRQLTSFFNFEDAQLVNETALYIGVIALGIPASFTSAAVSGTFNASGNSKTPFIVNSIGLVANMLLDPLLIFGLHMGVGGAALASIMAQWTVAAAMLFAFKRFKDRPFETFKFFDRAKGYSRQIFKWTLPIFLESTLFCSLTMITSRFEVTFGDFAIAMSRVGSQVESLTWLVGAGFGSALTAFVGQNFGAGREDRIHTAVRASMRFMTGWGLLVTALLVFGGGVVYAVFLPDASLRSMGITYLRILACCQLSMNWEAVTAGAFKGRGRTTPPSVTSIASNVLRVPLAYALSRTALGLYGIWVAISVSAALRGWVISAWYFAAERKRARAVAFTELKQPDLS